MYHPPTDGDPLFVTDPDEKVGRRKIYEARKGFHNHFPVWSHDGAFIYFVHGLVLEKSDIWRIRPTGDQPERLTFHELARDLSNPAERPNAALPRDG